MTIGAGASALGNAQTTPSPHGPKRWRYSVDRINAFTISALIKLPLNSFSLVQVIFSSFQLS
jgi:hypothetical protein